MARIRKVTCPVLILISVLVATNQYACGQEVESSSYSNYFRPMNQNMVIKVDLNNQIDGFKVSANDDLSYKIKPNARWATRISLNYHFLSLSYSYISPLFNSNKDDDLKGKTKYFNLSPRFQFNKIIQEIGYSRTKGYYLDNPKPFDPSWTEGDPYPQFPELVTHHYYGRTSYKWNPNFSTKAFLDQTEKQLRTTGSFIGTFSYELYQNDDRTKLTETNSSQKASNIELMAGGGYYQTFVLHRDFSLTCGAGAAGGVIHQKLYTRYIDVKYKTIQNLPILRGEVLGALGYNSPKFFAGTRVQFTGETYNQSKNSGGVINQNHFYVSFYLGFRLKAPKPVRKLNDEIEHILN
ncbi:DUF4421 family protein [Mangrovibacterium diazotrophicum]|uniref:Uncharacterized protein DUF4421 n=1 Tax=Mangrovibacterium diazotrophicum TaxID=1261403 RepID=A0A419W9M1_9BACT|nr:DUF4421 family protein [Mangrovibacterium diazotrophicum]RKD92149.1 uncharacterized protein DUF4421 [Mangrovibacterium diazotrophicum]